VDALKDKVEEVTLDLEILRGEIDKSGGQITDTSAQQTDRQTDGITYFITTTMNACSLLYP
jgi:hypothetical protein